MKTSIEVDTTPITTPISEGSADPVPAITLTSTSGDMSDSNVTVGSTTHVNNVKDNGDIGNDNVNNDKDNVPQVEAIGPNNGSNPKEGPKHPSVLFDIEDLQNELSQEHEKATVS